MQRVDVFVIGGGGTGSDVTYALSGAGLSVVMAERDRLGGECAHYGCDPTKAMLKAARVAVTARRAAEYGIQIHGPVEVDFDAVMRRVRRLIDEETSAGASIYEERGARVIMQEARLTGEHRVELADGSSVEADRIVLTTGSEATAPPVDGLDAGGYWTNKEAIWHGAGIPDSLAVIGGGAIGVELAQIYERFGARVTLIESSDRVLPPEDADSSTAIAEALVAEGISIRAGAKIDRVEHPGSRSDGRWAVHLEGSDPVIAQRLLVATGRKPCFDGHDLAAAGVRLDEEGRPVLTETLRTTVPHIWAGGDATGDLLFTHVGGYESGVIVADILGHPIRRDYRIVPKVTYCEPEVASVGLTEDQAREVGHDPITAVSRFEHNARAFIEGETAGHVKLVADRSSGEVLGGHIVGQSAGELIHEIVAVMVGRVPPRTAGDAIHAYPTLALTVRGAFGSLARRLEGALHD
jgi:pyruvate/2-oxoglutarate dehydrogenase complex dihydrolipoamide dehydrogenase (E3) component